MTVNASKSGTIALMLAIIFWGTLLGRDCLRSPRLLPGLSFGFARLSRGRERSLRFA